METIICLLYSQKEILLHLKRDYIPACSKSPSIFNSFLFVTSLAILTLSLGYIHSSEISCTAKFAREGSVVT